VSEALDALARKVQGDPFFLASPLALYARSEHLDDAGLAAALGCPPVRLSGLRLCRAPRADPAGFREDIAGIAAEFGLDPDRLADAVITGRAIRAIGAAPAGGRGFLMAARDEPPPDEGRPPGGGA
jgi:hypothetical protein